MKNCFLVLLVLALHQYEASKVVFLTRQQKACQFGHQVIRENHKEPSVEWDEDIAYGAEDWAIRCALKNEMEHSSSGLGENLYWTPLNSIPCANPLRNWYSGIKDFDYNNPEWTNADGTFIQEVYSTMKKFGIGTASYKHNLYVVGRYDKPVYSGGPFDQEHVPKPQKSSLSIDDLTPKPNIKPTYIKVTCPDVDGWTEWIQTDTCSAKCGIGSVVEERWCVRLHDQKGCEGKRKRTVSCEKKDCGSCKDLDMRCKEFADNKKCTQSSLVIWMTKHCPKSCDSCKKDNAEKSLIRDKKAVSKFRLLQKKAKAILL